MYVQRDNEQLGLLQAIPIAISTYQSIHNLFSGGPSLDDRVKQRIAWTVQMAQAGSAMAAALVLGGSHEPSVNAAERQAWTDVLGAVPSQTMSIAQSRFPNGYWPSGQPDFYSDTGGAVHQTIVREVNNAGASNDANGTNTYGPPPGGSGTQGLPPVRTVAPFNWTPFFIAGGALAVMMAFSKPSRRR